MTIEKTYRKNAGIVVFRGDKKVLLCKRIDNSSKKCWQFPQGGIEPGETILQAAYRELREETGLTSVKLVKQLDFPITYDYPPEIIKKQRAKGFGDSGQEQYWSLFYFYGQNTEIDFYTNPEEIEFSDYRWVELSEAANLVWPPKKEAYKKMSSFFAPCIESWQNG